MSKFICTMVPLKLKDPSPKKNTLNKKALSSKKIDISRFIKAQNEGYRYSPKYKDVIAELKDDTKYYKTLFYSWYILPVPKSDVVLGYLPKYAKYFHLKDGETKAYLENKTLRERLYETLHAISNRKTHTKKPFKYREDFKNYFDALKKDEIDKVETILLTQSVYNFKEVLKTYNLPKTINEKTSKKIIDLFHINNLCNYIYDRITKSKPRQ